MTIKKNKELIYISILFLILILKFFASLYTGLFEDEAIYWNWSQTVDASYSLTTIGFIRLFTLVFNSSSEIIVRLPALLSNAVMIFFIFKTGKLLNAKKEMIFITALTFLSIPFVTIYSAFISPDTFLLTFSVITVYYLLRSVNSDKIQDWVLCGLFAGLMVLSKYTASLFLLAMAGSIFLIFRKLPKNSLYLFITAAVTGSPLIIWNLINEPVWFQYYLLTNADKIDAGVFQTLSTFLLSQISILMPFGFLLIVILIVKLFRKKIKLPEIQTLKYLSIILLVTFLFFSFSGKIKGNWFFITYVPLLLFMLTIELKRYMKVLISSVVIFNFILLTVMNLSSEKIEALSRNKIAGLINDSFTYYWPDHTSNVNNDYSWSERIIKMKNWENAVNSIESNIRVSGEKYDFIASDDFTLCPLLEYYFKEKKDIYLIGDLRFKYINSAESFSDLKGKDAFIVTYNNSSQNTLMNKFEILKDIDEINFRVSEKISKDFRIIHGKSFLPDYTTKFK